MQFQIVIGKWSISIAQFFISNYFDRFFFILFFWSNRSKQYVNCKPKFIRLATLNSICVQNAGHRMCVTLKILVLSNNTYATDGSSN